MKKTHKMSNSPIFVGSSVLEVNIFKIKSCGAMLTVTHNVSVGMEEISAEIIRISKNSVSACNVLKALQKKFPVYNIEIS